jgi:hypothetical protein
LCNRSAEIRSYSEVNALYEKKGEEMEMFLTIWLHQLNYGPQNYRKILIIAVISTMLVRMDEKEREGEEERERERES